MAASAREKRNHRSRTRDAEPRERLLDVKAAAKMLGVAPSTVYQWSYERRIASVKIGASLRFRLSDIEKLIRQSLRPALADGPAGDDGADR